MSIMDLRHITVLHEQQHFIARAVCMNLFRKQNRYCISTVSQTLRQLSKTTNICFQSMTKQKADHSIYSPRFLHDIY